jgi:FkbM family methyltransferase
LEPEPDNVRNELKALRTEVEALRRLCLHSKQVDLVDWGGLRVFMFMDDLAYQQVAEEYRYGNTDCRPRLQLPSRPPAEVIRAKDADVLERLAAHMALHSLPFSHFDFGCQYGSGVMATTARFEAMGLACSVFAFDCGTAAALVPSNLALNGFAGSIHFERLAIGDSPGFAIVSSHIGHSEDCKVVNRYLHLEHTSWVVPRESIDSYVARHSIGSHLLMKIDTQGGEFEVWNGLQQCVRDRFVQGVIEFTPTALENRIQPGKLLARILATHHVLDGVARDAHGRFRALTQEDIARFVSEVRERDCEYTDLVFIPRNLPAVETLLQNLTD